jgi:hypothetical protein
VRCEATLELGRRLTKELDLDQSVDTLGRWMAHYIAELIHEAQNANSEERSAKMRACSETILSLWEHRHELPNGKRPFKSVEPILRALESLDPDDDTPRYFRAARGAAEEEDEDSDATAWLKLADGLDYTARTLITYCLTKGAEAAVDKTAEWVALAKAAGANDGIEFPLVRIVVTEKDLLEKDDLQEAEKKILQDRIARLEGFTEMAGALVLELRKKIQSLPSDVDKK